MNEPSHYNRPHASTTQASRYLQYRQSQEQESELVFDNPDTICTILDFFKPTTTQATLLLQYYAGMITELQNEYRCPHCRQRFSMWESLGLRGCNTHPGRMDDGVWKCCNWTNKREGASSSIKYEDPRYVVGCVEADHLIPGETRTLTPHQIDRVHNALSSQWPDVARSHKLSDAMIPHRLGPSSSVTVPYLLFCLLPHHEKRKVQKVIMKNVQSPDQLSNITNELRDDHPLANENLLLIDNTSAVDLLDINVCISRVEPMLNI